MKVSYGSDRSTWPTHSYNDMGYYVIPISSSGSTTKPKEDSWVRYDYVLRNQYGDIVNGYYSGSTYVNLITDAQLAKELGVYRDTIHYVPDFQIISDVYATGIPNGVRDAMKSYMHLGDSVRLVMIPEVSWQSAVSTTNSNAPIVTDIAIREIVDNIAEYKINEIDAFASTKYPAAIKDTVGLYYLHVTPPPASPVADSSKVRVWYVGRFLDGFVFDTNIADTAKAHNIYSAVRQYKELEVTLIEGKSNVYAGFERALRKMNVGSEIVTFSTSNWGGGYQAGTNFIYHIPIMFEIWMVSAEK